MCLVYIAFSGLALWVSGHPLDRNVSRLSQNTKRSVIHAPWHIFKIQKGDLRKLLLPPIVLPPVDGRPPLLPVEVLAPRLPVDTRPPRPPIPPRPPLVGPNRETCFVLGAMES